mgnify:CR=1 FL=1
MVKKAASRIYLALIFLFLYLPILVLIVLSFNNSKSRVVWGGFTLKWYAECFKNETITNAFVTTIQITLAAAIISTLLGTLAAIGISAMKKKNKAIMLGATNIPLLNAYIVTKIAPIGYKTTGENYVKSGIYDLSVAYGVTTSEWSILDADTNINKWSAESICKR